MAQRFRRDGLAVRWNLLSGRGNPLLLDAIGGIMHRLNYRLMLLGLAACAVAITGCPSGGAVVDTEHVRGVVTLDGEPVPEATVMFSPVTEGQGMAATGNTDANGVYELTAASTGEGAAKAGAGTLPGEYYVGVIKSVTETGMSEEEAHEKGVEYVAPAPGEAPEVTHVVPVKYNSPKDSGLKVTVEAGSNDIPIKLTSE